MLKVFKYTFLGLNIFVIICLFLGVLSTKISPEKTILFSYFGIVYPFFVLLNICFIIFWICFRKWNFIISTIALTITWSYTNDIFPISLPEKHSVRQSISVLSYNVALFDGGRQFDTIFSIIREKNPDIVCLQEFGFYKKGCLARERVFGEFAKFYPYRHIWYKNQFKQLEYGVVTYSKFPIINKQKIFYPSQNNITIFSDIAIEQDTIRVFNNHLESTKFSMKEKKNMKTLTSNELLSQETFMLTESLSRKLGQAFKIRAKQADAVAYAVNQSPYKTIVCGDFNDMPISYTYQKIKGKQHDLFVETSCGFDYTFHEMAMFLRIDHIFISPEFIPISCEIMHTDCSDHNPIIGQIGLK